MSEITNRARQLRNSPTHAEKTLGAAIKNKQLGVKFRRQYPIIYFKNDKRHCFIADFICLEKKLVIEVDGEVHNLLKDYDEMRTHIINGLGYHVIRFKNQQIETDINAVVLAITRVLFPAP